MKNNELKIHAQISWVYTHDLDSSARFYRDTLGLECLRDQGSARIFATAGNARIGVCLAFEDRAVAPQGSMISLVSDDVDACYRRLLERGVDIERPPQDIEAFGIRSFLVRDPDGYRLEFQQFLDKR